MSRRVAMSRAARTAMVSLMGTAAGCSWESNGVRHHLVIGVGMVDVAANTAFDQGNESRGTESSAARERGGRDRAVRGVHVDRMSASGLIAGAWTGGPVLVVGAAEWLMSRVDVGGEALLEVVSRRDGSVEARVTPIVRSAGMVIECDE
ncbi:MAG TPA: hypothetical protein VG797_01070 [Phycisphaerales bacterium]|nr:hypothetical protein [Phycisphaerales bacterium]